MECRLSATGAPPVVVKVGGRLSLFMAGDLPDRVSRPWWGLSPAES
jgi:hypothetical protein